MPAANLQTVMVPKDLAQTRDEAREIARQYANRIYTSRETPNYWRFRQRPLKDFKKGSKHWRTYEVPDSGGVKQVFGTLTKAAEARDGKPTRKRGSKKAGAGPAGPRPKRGNPTRRAGFSAPARPGVERWETSIALVGRADSPQELAELATRVDEFAESSTMAGRFAQAVQERAELLGLPCSTMAPMDCTQYLIGRFQPEIQEAPALERWRDAEMVEGEQGDLFRTENPGTPLHNPRRMPHPGACAWLGSLLEWKWKERPGSVSATLKKETGWYPGQGHVPEILWEPEGPWLFLWSKKLKAVVAVPAIPTGAMRRLPKVSRKDGGAKMFERFSARSASNTWGIKIPDVPLKRLGEAVHIVYRSDKWNPPHEVDYIHDFGRGVHLYCGPNLKSPEVFLCFGGRLTATERGLVY